MTIAKERKNSIKTDDLKRSVHWKKHPDTSESCNKVTVLNKSGKKKKRKLKRELT